MDSPLVILVGGPNGAGKSTSAPVLLRDTFDVTEFVNADVIAQGLSGFDPTRVGIEAGRIMLRRLKRLATERRSFAFETTLASRTFAPWLRRLRKDGYSIGVLFLWLPTADQAVSRVRFRVSRGGHDVPEEAVRRRYHSGLSNFFRLYLPLADMWCLYDNRGTQGPQGVATKPLLGDVSVQDPKLWRTIQEATHD